MSLFPKPYRLIPVSLLLLFAAYLVVGWNWALYRETWTQSFALLAAWPQLFWPGAALITLVTIAVFTEPLAGIRRWLHQAFESDTKMFFTVILLTSLSILLLVHMEILAKGMLLLSTISLARFDFQLAKLNHWSAFFYLSIFAILGLLSGAMLHWAWGHYELPMGNG
ncbi:MAG: hypothetical protein HC824_03495 [Synechococcales cyanobacterium RM1_1_8]|nr:hypothetical protein [Synechococcales cyanobacterium RM1_1_8]